MTKLALRGLTKRFGEVAAVDGVDLAIEPGEFVSLLGPSGCGKTTTLRMIAGFIDPTAGSIEMDGRVLSSPGASLPPERRGMSMIFQSYAVWPNMTVAENVAFGLRLRRLANEEVRRRVGEMLDVVQMRHLAERYPAELSGGQQQRVALARAIVIQPQVLLLDEPHALYTRPKTRFVAGFIGRTNFIEGSCNGAAVEFDGFAVPRDLIAGGAGLDGKVTFSVRPQSMKLARARFDGAGPQVAVTIVERAYLGEFWDYVVAPANGALRLKVTAPPLEVYAVGDAAVLGIDPAQMAPIA
jgi:iron(III) transport system ATP-binding protein